MEKRNLVLEQETVTSLEKEVQQLGPWYYKIPIDQTGNKFTTDFNTANSINQVEDPNDFKKVFEKVPTGLKGKTVLDIGCNGGGHSILAHKMGADYVLGFDARKNWIDQANFLRDNMYNLSSDQVDFKVQHINELENLDKKFDIVLMKDVLNFLLDPIHALKMASDLTNDLLILQFTIGKDTPEDSLRCRDINPESSPMVGVQHLCWTPGGIKVAQHILEWAGFSDFHIHQVEEKGNAFDAGAIKQVCLFAAKDKQVLGDLARVEKKVENKIG